MIRLRGRGVSAGLGTGRVVRIDEPVRTDGAGADFDGARRIAAARYRSLADTAAGKGAGEMSDLFEAYLLMLEDPDLEDGVRARIAEGAEPAEAVTATGEELARMLMELDDEYMKERAADVQGVCRDLADIMTGREKTGPALDSPSVLVARDLSPADTLNLDTGNLKALVLREGSPNGHTAILAQLLGIPAVIGAGEALDAAEEGMTCLVDGASGTVILEPDEAALGEFRSKYSAGEAEQAALARYRDIPAVTPRGRRIRVYCNIGSPEEAQAALACGCEGIGLFRTEFLYLRGGSYPSEEAQCEAYRSVLEAMGDKPVIVRTCDIGSDKTAPYLQLPEEENPALGIRGIRLCLRRRDMFLCQLRALLRASVYGRLSVMFPMVSSLSELLEARALWREAEKQLEQEGVPFRSRVPLGVMIETPAAALMADTLAEEADFFSIGTNDLTQYTLAADRQSGDAADIFDPSHPAVKKLIAMTCAAAKSRGKLAGICGNSAGDASLLEFYEEAGVGELSVSPGRCLSLKRDICEL